LQRFPESRWHPQFASHCCSKVWEPCNQHSWPPHSTTVHGQAPCGQGPALLDGPLLAPLLGALDGGPLEPPDELGPPLLGALDGGPLEPPDELGKPLLDELGGPLLDELGGPLLDELDELLLV
jgi:hypothetical protein